MALCLMYHSFGCDEKSAADLREKRGRYVLTRSVFERQLEITSELRYRFLEPEQMLSQCRWPDRSILLTFDDSWASHEWAADFLSHRCIKALFLLNSGDIGSPGMVTPQAVRRMAALGHEIGSHGAGHSFMTRLSDVELNRSLTNSKSDIERTSGAAVRFVSFPGGRFDARVTAAARASGYQVMFSSRPGLLRFKTGRIVLNRVVVTADISPRQFRGMLKRPMLSVAPRRLRYQVLKALRGIFSQFEKPRRGGA